MYEKINNDIEKILLDKDVSHFNGYYYLLDNLYKVHVSKDAEYQKYTKDIGLWEGYQNNTTIDTLDY